MPSNFKADGNALTVTNFTHADWGMYVCIATNQDKILKQTSMVFAEGSNSFILFLLRIIVGGPYFISLKEPPSAQIRIRGSREAFKRGEHKSLTCYNYGNPKPEVDWYFDNVNVKYLTDRFTKLKNTLLIHANKNLNILGVYTCVAIGLHNRIGVSNAIVRQENENFFYIEHYSNSSFTTTTKRNLKFKNFILTKKLLHLLNT